MLNSENNYQVSVSYISWCFKLAEKLNRAQTLLLSNVPYSKDWLLDQANQITWDAFCQFSENALTVFSESEFLEAARLNERQASDSNSYLLTRFMMSVQDIYFWAYRTNTGYVATNFPMLKSSINQVDSFKLTIELTCRPEIHFPRALLLILRSQLQEFPSRQGYQPAVVDMEKNGNNVSFYIQLSSKRTVLNRAKQFLARLQLIPQTNKNMLAALNQEYERYDTAVGESKISQERFQLLADNMNDVIWSSDFSLNFNYISPSVERILGYTANDFLTLTLQDFMSAEMVLKAEAIVSSAMSGFGEPNPSSFELILQHKKGYDVPVEISLSLLHDSQNQPIGFIGATRDITSRHSFEKDKSQLESQLRQMQKVESLGALAGGIAHDFNNLLMIIQGNSELLTAFESLSEKAKTRINEIDKATDRAVNLTRQLLAYGRRQLLEPKLLNINDLVPSISKMLERLIPENVEFEFMPGNRHENIFADAGQIEQIIVNLAINARDAMPDGGEILIRTDSYQLEEAERDSMPHNHFSVISIKDTGEGMSKREIDAIFEPFYTTKPVGKGTGLGLSVVQGIVEQHEGFIRVSSEPNQGSEFRVYLPVAKYEAEPFEVLNTARNTSGDERILLVEDDEKVREIARYYLESAGYSVVAVENGRFALDFFEQGQDTIDLIVSDIIMPLMSGLDLMERIRYRGATVPFIFISGYPGSMVDTSVLKGDDVDFIAKPYTSEVLLTRVRYILDKQI